MLPQEVRHRSGVRNVRNALLLAAGLLFAISGMFGYDMSRRAVTVPAAADGDTSGQVVGGLALMLVAIVSWRRGRRRGARLGDSATR
jgi:hypothetical protein